MRRSAPLCSATGVAWAAWLHTASAHLPQRQAPDLLGVSRPTWRLWLSGAIPDADTVCTLAANLGAVQDEALLAAGYAPRSLPVQTMLEMLRVWHGRMWMHPALYHQISRVLTLSAPRQVELAGLLAAFVDAHCLDEARQRKKEDKRARAKERKRETARRQYSVRRGVPDEPAGTPTEIRREQS